MSRHVSITSRVHHVSCSSRHVSITSHAHHVTCTSHCVSHPVRTCVVCHGKKQLCVLTETADIRQSSIARKKLPLSFIQPTGTRGLRVNVKQFFCGKWSCNQHRKSKRQENMLSHREVGVANFDLTSISTDHQTGCDITQSLAVTSPRVWL